MIPPFMFATGIENSDPTVGRRGVDEMEKCRHYERWRDDFDCVVQLGLHVLRYGPPLHRTWLGPGRYGEFADATIFKPIEAHDEHDLLGVASTCSAPSGSSSTSS